MVRELRRFWQHAEWADKLMIQKLTTEAQASEPLMKELSHIFGAYETWLSRIERREARVAVWPFLSLSELQTLANTLHREYTNLLSGVSETTLLELVSYKNSDGQPFETPLGEILTHVVLHAQYHRGKVNLLMRQLKLEPAPVDYIGFVRGVAAASTQHNKR